MVRHSPIRHRQTKAEDFDLVLTDNRQPKLSLISGLRSQVSGHQHPDFKPHD